MNKHDQNAPNYLEIMRYEKKIVNLLNHNVHKYRYIGEEGKEYEVIQSIFNEISHAGQLSNKHIRWYAVIINLWMNFQRRRMNTEKIDAFPDFSSTDSNAENIARFSTQMEKGKAEKLPVPSYIGHIELYINEISRLGMLVCTKEELNPGYPGYKLERIHTFLTDLLTDMDTQKREEIWEEVFILTIKNAADNVITLGKSLRDNRNSFFTETINSEDYQRLINRRIRRIDEKRLALYKNMEAFWNGFIP